MTTPEKSLMDALVVALQANPSNPPLWLHLADIQIKVGERKLAIDSLRQALNHGAAPVETTIKLASLLRELGEIPEALIRLESLISRENDPRIRLELARVLLQRGDNEDALAQYKQAVAGNPDLFDSRFAEIQESTPTNEVSDDLVAASVTGDPIDVDRVIAEFADDSEKITFKDVVGLDAVKNQIHLRVLAPLQKKDIFKAFRKSGGGGILLYGPPGCGKTFVARATAGELGARFMVVSIHDIVDKYWGESEKNIHHLFEEARKHAPTVVFFDEFDALGASRGRSDSQFWVTLIDQLLQEMDGISGRNNDVLVFAATNLPWNVDAAFRRPGRFDRLLFVPPPDESARAEILRRHIMDLPGGPDIPVGPIAKNSGLFSGADLKSLCERASEHALTRSLQSSSVHPVTLQDFTNELQSMRNSTHEWFATARNYVRYANEGGQYDELAKYLRHVKIG